MDGLKDEVIFRSKPRKIVNIEEPPVVDPIRKRLPERELVGLLRQ
jgi:hypothetical protein